MDKRDLVKGVALGTLSLIVAGTGGKSALAGEQDWRDELIGEQTGWHIHYHNVDDIFEDGNGNSILLNATYWFISIDKVDNGYQVKHYRRDMKYMNDENMYNENLIRLEGHNTIFTTLKEAFYYAKGLRNNYG